MKTIISYDVKFTTSQSKNAFKSNINVNKSSKITFKLNNSTSSLSLSQPTKVSQLVNDKNYMSSNNINSIINIVPISNLEASDDWDLI